MGLFNNTNNYDPYTPQVDRKRLLIVVGLGLGVLVAISLMLMVIFNGGNKDAYMRMLVHQQELQTLTDSSQKRIRSSDLAKINSSAALLLSSDSTALNMQLDKRYGEKTVPADFRKNNQDTTIESKLKQAELLNKFDTTYRNLLIAKINAIVPEAEPLKNEGNREFNVAVQTAIKNLQEIRSQLEALSL